MSVLKQSDLWFGVVTIMFFGFLAVIFFGPAITSKTFWMSAAAFTAFAFLGNLVGRILGKFGPRIEAIGAFCLGAVFAYIYQVIRADGAVDIELVVTSGLGFFLITYIFRLREEKETANG